jgi:hypothetical protein
VETGRCSLSLFDAHLLSQEGKCHTTRDETTSSTLESMNPIGRRNEESTQIMEGMKVEQRGERENGM